MRVKTSQGQGNRPKVVEVLGTQNFAFKQTPTSTPAAAPRAPAAAQTHTPQPPPGHPGYAKLNAAASQATQPPPQSEKSHVETDSTYISVDLPTQFQMYPFKKLSLRPLQGLQIAKFSRAQKEENMRHIVDAISSTLEPGISAYDLQPGDFYYLMYWQRVNSFSKNPMLIEAWCTDKKHNLEVIEGIMDEEGKPVLDAETRKPMKKEKESLKLSDIVSMTTLDVQNLATLDLTPFAELEEKYGLGYETIRDVVDVTDVVVESEDGAPEFAFLAGKAAFLRPMEGRVTIQERCKIVENMTPDEIALLDQYIEVITDYGVAESTNLKCKDCGASTKINISFDALTFLPSGR